MGLSAKTCSILKINSKIKEVKYKIEKQDYNLTTMFISEPIFPLVNNPISNSTGAYSKMVKVGLDLFVSGKF